MVCHRVRVFDGVLSVRNFTDVFQGCRETALQASVLPCFELMMIVKEERRVCWPVLGSGLFGSCLGSSWFQYWHTEWES